MARHLPKNWLPLAPTTPPIQRIAIIGAGIAGAALAQELALAGLDVLIFEQTTAPATGASGNLAGNCLPIIDQRPDNPYAQWHWLAWQRAVHWWEQQPNREQLGQLTGAAKWSTHANNLTAWQAWANSYPDSQVQWMDALPLAHQPAGLWFPQGGSFYPRRIVQHLLTHANIQLHTQTTITQLTYTGQHWQLISHPGCFEADAVIIASGAQTALAFPEWGQVLQLNKGQVSHVSSSVWKHEPSFALSYGGYASPTPDGITCIGASFEQQAPLGLTDSAHLHNLALLNQAYPNALTTDALPTQGHSAYRASTYDHLPLVGPVVDIPDYQAAIHSRCHQPDTIPDLSSLLRPQL
ncbi:MAG TPA: FAD-dependent 5-carboxymethylaminomethyl-2-thiouridine(34) oxidoreductase MnmC, partial [Thiotrichales bacterium]|nr:FAD-dependent 5-carboxymethylaminomethyl-2-thiouridine(34) oxidoreductase MnmC [Thiotrichales bacterium]